ncbi:SRPBCC family protein [Paenibacillus brasilensis]|uniref:SRPBCC family protein n=1 Tax=Paenibacillus brasilensis TaxID=128574 RepID=UPI00351FD8A0
MFLDVIPFERLVFTWGYPDAPIEDSLVVTLTLTAQGDRIEMIFHLRGLLVTPAISTCTTAGLIRSTIC